MKNYRSMKRKLLAISLVTVGSSLFANNCINTAASLPICGAVLTFCTPSDQINLLWPLLETPDFSADPSCTIPLGCGRGTDGNFFPNAPGGIPGGDTPEQPTDESDPPGGGQGGAGGGGI